MRSLLRSLLLIAAAIAAVVLPAKAQTGADFYKGKTVTYIVSTAPGGGYDLYGRLIAEFMQKYLPGSTFVVKNLPGAGHLVGTNTIYASKPDGLTIGTFNTGLIYNQLIGLDGVKFDLNKMSWIGKAASDPRIIAVHPDLPIKTFSDLQRHKDMLNFSTSGPGSAAYVETVMLAKALKLPAKIMTGYNGSDDQLAMRRGEIQAAIASRSSWEGFVKNGYGRFVIQIGGTQPDLPQLSAQVQDSTARALIALVQSQGDISRLTAGPPDIPPDRLAALRDAYRKSMEDPELQGRAEKLERPVDPAFGEDVLRMVQAALNQTPETIAILKEAMSSKDNPK
jgi:tripartite-type tricarboxylate transporter receptor subunit TctC